MQHRVESSSGVPSELSGEFRESPELAAGRIIEKKWEESN
jgi:hypothetical protein